MFWLTAAGIFLAFFIVVWCLRPRRPGVVVIGQELAAASRREDARLSQPHDPSPLSGKSFPDFRSPQGVFDPSPCPLDDEVRELAKRFRAADADAKSRIAGSLSMDDLYTLIAFADRAAIFAIRRKDPALASDAASAFVMIDFDRIDFRDGLTAMSHVCYALNRVGENAKAALSEAASHGGPGADAVREFAARAQGWDSLRGSWLKEEVQTANGASLIGWDGRRYNPTADLTPAVLRLATILSSDQYAPDASLATEVPSIWFGGKTAEPQLKALRAVATISAERRQENRSALSPYHMLLWFAEAKDAESAQAIARLAETRPGRENAVLTVTEGNMVCVVSAWSFVQGTPSIETDLTIARFTASISQTVHEHVLSMTK